MFVNPVGSVHELTTKSALGMSLAPLGFLFLNAEDTPDEEPHLQGNSNWKNLQVDEHTRSTSII